MSPLFSKTKVTSFLDGPLQEANVSDSMERTIDNVSFVKEVQLWQVNPIVNLHTTLHFDRTFIWKQKFDILL